MTQLTEKERLARISLGHVLERHPETPTIFEVEPRGLDDLKAWLGIPNGHVAPEHRVGMLRSVNSDHLPEAEFNYADLPVHQQRAVIDQAHNLLFGMVDAAMLEDRKIQAVVKHMLESAKRLPLTAGDNLTIKDGETYELKTPVASFNTITIQGTGTIRLTQNAKVVCDQLIFQP